jgi:energy-coupling factor transporter ATP-binding protein EcfA2
MSNPFSTRFVRPGAIPFIFPPGISVESLVKLLRQHQWRGAIVGPHGSGKSTLLETLIPAIEQAGRVVQKVNLHDGQRRLPADFEWPNSKQPVGVVVIDGYEQLGWWARRQLNWACRRDGWGLLVTVHSSAANFGLPELHRVQPSLETFQQVVHCLLASTGTSIRPDEVVAAYQPHPQNLREALFALYDLVEQRRTT